MPELKKFMTLPARPGVCPECGADHTQVEPHNKTSIFYNMRFHEKHDRWPTWLDAIAHCSAEMKAAWLSELKKLGVKLPEQKKEVPV